MYTAAELTGLVAYGAARGVWVLFEMDTPGHSFSWSLGRPDLVVCASLADQTGRNCPEPPCGYLDLRSEQAATVAAEVRWPSVPP